MVVSAACHFLMSASSLSQHLIRGIFPKDAHFFRIEISVVCHNAFKWQNRPGIWVGRFHWPAAGGVAIGDLGKFLNKQYSIQCFGGRFYRILFVLSHSH